MSTTQIPTLQELHCDVQEAFKNDQLNLLLNQPPHKSWLKKYPAVMGISGEYLPVDKVDFMLKRIFGNTQLEVREVKQLLNSIHCTVRIHYKNPVTGEWEFQDGVGAAPLQLDAATENATKPSSIDFTYLKQRAVQMAVPIAKSAAKKDAAEELGALFGRDLNRKDVVMFAGAFTSPETSGPAPKEQQKNGQLEKKETALPFDVTNL